MNLIEAVAEWAESKPSIKVFNALKMSGSMVSNDRKVHGFLFNTETKAWIGDVFEDYVERYPHIINAADPEFFAKLEQLASGGQQHPGRDIYAR